MTHRGPSGSVTSVPSWKPPFSQKSISAWKICSEYNTPPLQARAVRSLPPQFPKGGRGSGIQNTVLYSKEGGSNGQIGKGNNGDPGQLAYKEIKTKLRTLRRHSRASGLLRRQPELFPH